MELENTLKIILFLTTTTASVVSFKVVKENNIPFPKNSIEFNQVRAQIIEEAPEAIADIWKNDLSPALQEAGDWFFANVAPEIQEFFQEEVQPEIQEEWENQESTIKEKIEEESDKIKDQVIPQTLENLEDVVKGEKKCEWVCE